MLSNRKQSGKLGKSTRNRTLSPADHPEIWDMYARGYSQPEIAKHYGVTQGRISQIISEFRVGVPQLSREEIITTFLAGCRDLYESAMTDVRNARDVNGRSAARRDVVLIQKHIAQMLGAFAYPLAPAHENMVRYVIEVEAGQDPISSEEIMKELT